MFLAILLSSALLADTPEVKSTVLAADLVTYETLRAKVGRDAAAHVNLALWCEAHGLQTERLSHLALAVLNDPKNVTARSLMGLMAYRKRWESPEQVGAEIKADEAEDARRAEYAVRREQLLGPFAGKVDRSGRRSFHQAASAAHLALGQWCETIGLGAEAKAHFTSAVVNDPHNSTAWTKLGYTNQDGRWMSPEQIAAEKGEAEAQLRATRHWEPLFKKWRGWLAGDKHAKRDEARALLAEMSDPRAVPAIVHVFHDGSEAHERLVVQLLGQIESPAATRALAWLAVLGPSPELRSAACQVLRSRPSQDFAGKLVDQIRAPMRYQVQPVAGPGSPGSVSIETPRYRMIRHYDAPPVIGSLSPYGYAGYDPNGMPIFLSAKEARHLVPAEWGVPGFHPNFVAAEQRAQVMIAAANLKATTSQQILLSDVSAIEQSNAETNAWNERVASVLQSAVDAAPALEPGDEDGWHRWWYDRVGYRYDPPAQITVYMNASPQPPAPSITSCFVAGTPVRTLDGLRPIETLQVGDQVLSQDTQTGALTFQTILVVHHNPPGATLRLALENGELLLPSIYHRFWRAGQGWTLARDLKPGDILRTFDGLTTVKSIGHGDVQPLYNLDVAESRTYFVGDHGALVHDNRIPVDPIKPFDAAGVAPAGTLPAMIRD